MNKSTWPAPAKLNLFLHITGRRADGYHLLQTLFQLLDWGDELIIEATRDGAITRAQAVAGVPEREDLTLCAAQLLQRESGCKQGAKISLSKHIPLGAGLGGGSSDAATVLHALNNAWGCGLSIPDLAELGARLGADVPVFVHGQSAWAEGIGDQLQAFSTGEPWYVLVFPGIAVSSAMVFADPGLKRDTAPIQPSQFDLAGTGNDCAEVVLRLFPALREIMRDLAQWGSPRLTGTGSCIYLPVCGKNQANRITKALESRYNVRAVRGVDHSPLSAKLAGGR